MAQKKKSTPVSRRAQKQLRTRQIVIIAFTVLIILAFVLQLVASAIT